MNEAELYNRIYTERPDKWNLTWRDQIAFHVLSAHVQQPDSLLDIGCGNGHTIEYFRLWWPETTYYGIDLSGVAIALAEKRNPEAQLFIGDFVDAALPHCDVVTLMGVAEHIADLESMLSYLGEIGGLIYIESPNCLAYSDSKEEGYRQTHAGSGQREWHLSRDTWERHIRSAGLEIVKSIKGQMPTTEFIWLLKGSNEQTGANC